MMKKFYAVLLAAVCTAGVLSGVDFNLLNNADFKECIDGVPVCWNTMLPENKNFTMLPGAGPNGSNVIKFVPGFVHIAQGGVFMVPGEKYRVGAYVRTKKFSCRKANIAICDHGSSTVKSSKNFPADTNGKWQKFEFELECFEPARSARYYGWTYYSYRIFLNRPKGEIEIANPYVIPVSPGAKKAFRRSPTLFETAQIVPITPMLDKIPSNGAEVKFYWPLDKKARISANISTIVATRSVSGELKDSYATLKFGRIHPGAGILYVRVLTPDNKLISRASFPVTVIDVQKPTPVKWLNNLTAVVKDEKIKNGSFNFVTERDTWVFVRCTSGTVKIDGEKLLFEKRGKALECMKYLRTGKHTVQISGAGGGKFLMRRVPEITAYPFSPFRKNDFDRSFYTPEFIDKHMVAHVNAFNLTSTWQVNSGFRFNALQKILKSGRQVTASGGLQGQEWNDPNLFARDLMISRLHGRAIDEIGGEDHYTRLTSLTKGLWLMRGSDLICNTWSKGHRLYLPHIHHDLISAQINASRGRGKIMAENYIVSGDTMKEQLEYFDKIRDEVMKVQKIRPDYCQHTAIFNGCYVIPGSYFTAASTESDPKYTHDMFFRMLASDPVFKDLYGIGIYSLGSGDEEMYRWYGQLFRHYAIEGNKTLLSEKYGFKFAPGHLLNGDFREGLKSWSVSGDVKAAKISGYGRLQGRRPNEKAHRGNAVAILKATAQKSAAVSQKAKGFTPGKSYSIIYVEADRDMVKKKKPHRNKVYLDLQLTGAKVVAVRNFSSRNREASFTVHKVIFKAEKPEIEVKFTASPKKAAGKEIVLNYVAVRPYFEN